MFVLYIYIYKHKHTHVMCIYIYICVSGLQWPDHCIWKKWASFMPKNEIVDRGIVRYWQSLSHGTMRFLYRMPRNNACSILKPVELVKKKQPALKITIDSMIFYRSSMEDWSPAKSKGSPSHLPGARELHGDCVLRSEQQASSTAMGSNAMKMMKNGGPTLCGQPHWSIRILSATHLSKPWVVHPSRLRATQVSCFLQSFQVMSYATQTLVLYFSADFCWVFFGHPLSPDKLNSCHIPT